MGRNPYHPKPTDEDSSSASETDTLLAGVGYTVRSSDLLHVADRLEKLDSTIIAAAASGVPPEFLCSSAIHYNPSDLASWIDSLLTEVPPHSSPSMWTDATCLPPPSSFSIDAHRLGKEEDAGIRLVHLLMTCADSIQRDDLVLARSLIDEMHLLLPLIGVGYGIGKVSIFFLDALDRRISFLPQPTKTVLEDEILYSHFYEACPNLKFAHFTANQAILEAFNGSDRVHLIDLGLMHGLQWPALIQALALRPGGPPALRLTGIGPKTAKVGLRLAEFARSVGVPFTFQAVAAGRLDSVRVKPGEAVAINSVLQLHLLLSETGPIDSVLTLIRELRPKILTVVEQDADHNKPAFLDRFTEALFYYSTLFDSLAASGGGGRVDGGCSAAAEVYLQREICNIVCCEGSERVERHEPMGRWRVRLGRAGFEPMHLGSNAFRQASMLLKLFSSEGYGVEEVEGCLSLSWHGRSLISASAWRARGDSAVAPLARHRYIIL
ncbi:hypothetical protein KFK09_026063 [Dendrobium nobile]|uniref:DELLA protein n=1 Tax=Dendrobium nobile TaxID=94219 RepID=A0A8T3A7K7_DENNO|nr:hypothetical protein KFK09_026063 [Dendrobium nobile]